MRIGVLTLPLHTNYGGILQAYALQRVLQDMGHDVVLLDSYPQCPTLKPFPLQQMLYLKRLLMKVVAPHKAIPLFYEKEAMVRYQKKEHIRQFFKEYATRLGIPICKIVYKVLTPTCIDKLKWSFKRRLISIKNLLQK